MSFTAESSFCDTGLMELTADQRTELESVLRVGYDGSVSARAQMVLWRADGHSVAGVAAMAGTTKPTVYKWIDRFEQGGLAGLDSREVDGTSAVGVGCGSGAYSGVDEGSAAG